MSFKNDAILDLRKTSFREHKAHIIKINNFELLKSVAIYGANASGKSNFISSIATFKDIINRQFYHEKETEDDDEISSRFKIKSFLFTNKINDAVEFEIIFLNKSLYQYGISIESGPIKSEWLMIDNEMVFERFNKKIEYKTLHNVYDDDGNVIGNKLLDLYFESSGTLRFFSFIQEILDIMNYGGVFIVDGLSSRLHPQNIYTF